MQQPDEPTQAMPAFEADGPAPRADDSAGSRTVDDARRGPRPLVWALAVLLVLALIGGVVWFAVSTTRANREASIRDTATAYLTAVAEGDAAAALNLLAEKPANVALLTDDALAASKQAAPLTEIRAGAVGGGDDTPTVDVSYRLGEEAVSTTLKLTGDGSSWKVSDGTGELVVPERRALTVNGVTLTEENNPVFPGRYTAAPVNDRVRLDGETVGTIATPEQDPTSLQVTPVLSEAGREVVLNAVRTRYDECLAATESRPANCPFGVSTDGVQVAEGSVRFTGVNNPWEGFAPTLDPGAMTVAGKIPFEVRATATVSRGGLSMDATTALRGERGYTVDLNQDPAVVSWW